MWGIIPAAGRGSRIQPLGLLQGTAAGRQPHAMAGPERPRAVSEYLVERMIAGGADQHLLRHRARQVRHPGILRRPAMAMPPIAYRRAAARRRACAMRSSAPTPLVARRRTGADRPARYGLVSGRRALPRFRTTALGFLLFPVDRPQHCSTPSSPTRQAGCARSRSSSQDAGSNWIWGAFKMPGAVFRCVARPLAGARPRRRISSARWSTPISATAARPSALGRGSAYVDVGTLHGYREAMCLLQQNRSDAVGQAMARRSRLRTGCSERDARGMMPMHFRLDEIRKTVDSARARGSTISTCRGARPRPTISSGDYPAVKWRRFADAIPADLTRQDRARHRLQRRLLFDRDEAARRRARARHRLRRRLSRAGPVRRRGRGRRYRIPAALRLRRRRARRAFRPRAFHGRALPFAPSAAGARPDPRACRRRHVRVPVDAARQRRASRSTSDYPFWETGAVRPARPFPSCISSSSATPAIRPTGGFPNRACAEAMLRSAGFEIVAHPEEEVYHLPARRARRPIRRGAVYPARGRRGMIEAAMIWNEPNNKSHWDPELDPDWARFAAMAIAGRRGDRGRGAAASPRVLGGISPIDPAFMQQHEGQGRSRPCRRRRRARLSARLESLADPRMAAEARRDPARDRSAGLGLARSASPPSAPRRCRSSGLHAHRRTAHRPGAAHPLVQPVRSAAAWPATTRHREAEGSSYYRHFYMGLMREDGTPKPALADFAAYTPELGICQWFHFEDPPAR